MSIGWVSLWKRVFVINRRWALIQRWSCDLVTSWVWKQSLYICRRKVAYNYPPSHLREPRSLCGTLLLLKWIQVVSCVELSLRDGLDAELNENVARAKVQLLGGEICIWVYQMCNQTGQQIIDQDSGYSINEF